MPERGLHAVAPLGELPPGSRKIVEVDGRSIGLFNVRGRIIAVLKVCPHELVPVCLGRWSGTTTPAAPGQFHWGREGEILRCPWHGWEFDLLSGDCLTGRRRLRRFPTRVADGQVYVDLIPGAKA